MERWNGRVALVTGASCGIGAALAIRLVKCGMKVIGCARDVHKIEKLANEVKSEKGTLVPIKCDLRKEEEILSMFKRIKTEFGGVDICVNNAGLGHSAPLLSGTTEMWRNMLDVNVLALCICSREAVNQMIEKGADDGHVILVNSMSGHRVIPSPPGHFYSATKFAVTALTEGLRVELRQKNSHIRVTSISPGLVRTEFAPRMRQNQEEAEKFYNSFKCMESDDIVDSIMYALSAPPHVQIHDILLRGTEQVN